MTANPNSIFYTPLLKRRMQASLQWCVILIGISVPISVAVDNVLLALVLLGSLLCFGDVLRTVQTHRVARASLLLFGVLTVAMFYGNAPLAEALSILGKYIDLMFIPIFIVLLADETARRRARYAFIATMALTLFLSYLVALNILPLMWWMNVFASADNPVIFHSHITQNNMMGFAVFLALVECRDASTLAKRIAWGLFALLGAFNVLFMVQGRTGYLIFLVLLGWLVWASLSRLLHKQGKAFGWRQGSLIVATLLAATFVAYFSSARMHERVALVASDYKSWTMGGGKFTSTGLRLEFYFNTLQIVREHPLFGVGTGGFPAAFAHQTEGKVGLKTENPHNEYLMISVQTGMLGLALLLYLYYTQWRYAPMLPTALEQDAARGLVLAYVVNCLFNSALLDHADGLFFAFMTAVLFAGLKGGARHA